MKHTLYTQEFKDSSVQLALNSNEPVVKTAKDLGIHHKTLHSWIAKYKSANNIKHDARRNNQTLTPKETLEAENRRLRAENNRLKQEKEILKKAAAYFAKETL